MVIFTRVLGQRQRIFGGWMQKDRIKLNGKELKGYIKTTRKNGAENVSTHFKEQVVVGEDLYWLAKRNGRNLKVPELQRAAA